MGEWFEATAFSGSLALAIPVAVIAGLVSFFSPCVIPLLPGYLSYATGLSAAELADAPGARRSRMLLGSALFVLGFGAVFVAYGALFGTVGDWLVLWRREVSLVLGALTIVLGLVFAGALPRLPWLNRDLRIHRVPAVGLAAAPLLGILFGLGWTPCVGPTLGAIVALATSDSQASAARGALLSAWYVAGLGLPFVIAGLAYARAMRAVGFLRRHQRWVSRAGGLLLVTVGLLLVTGWWDIATAWLQVRMVGTFETSL
ncbi:MAG: cytochrome c biogenesis CcdA family protein [Nocardioides sp.]